ncbi:retrovirus-related Pol poly from transposon isoform X1 [Pelobates cultripes]|uniref:Retrovirus-related Pol poly from transposon isoform X1 n=1 Tax=Pelobates cultripes TaxID=61616 RepID=A0AAD1RRI1_PELCU|nr:retrovirus-related Pol poly from transposon isoform X1 [Pelobates cultripes]
MKPLPGDRTGRWRMGTCLQKVAPRSYLVDIEGTLYRRNCVDLRVAEKSDSQYPVDKPDTPGIPRSHSHVGSEECTKVIPQTSTNGSPEQAGPDSSQLQSMPVSGGKSPVTSERAKRLFAQPGPVFTRSGRHSQPPKRLNL